MKKLLLLLLLNLFAILISMAQIVNKFRDSSQFTKGVRFDSTLHFAGLKTGVAADTIILVTDVNGIVKKVNKSSLLVSTQTSLNDSISALRLVRKVDTLYRNLDSIIFTINGVRRAIKDTLNQIPTLTFTKNSTKDSIITTYNGIRYAVKDSVGSTSGFVPYNGATQDVDLGAWALNAFAVKINGTNGNGHINLRHQASNATAQGQSSTIFADNNGDLKWKNDGLSYATFRTSGITADRVYRFPDSTGTVALLTNIPTIPTFTLSKSTNRDSIVTTYNGVRSAVFDSSIVTPTFSLSKNTNRDSIITVYNGVRSAVRDSINPTPTLTYGFGVTRDTMVITYNGVRTALRDSTGGGGGSLSTLTAATASNTINNVNNTQEWQWNSLSGTGLKLSNNFTGSQSGSILLDISNTGTIPSLNTTTALRVTNNKLSSSGGTSTGIRVDVNNGLNPTFGLQVVNSGSNGGAAIDITSTATVPGIQLNGSRLSMDASSVGTLQYTGSILQMSSNASRTLFINTGTSNYWGFTSSTSANYLTVNRIANGSYGIVFNGDYFSSNYRSELTSNNVIKASGGSLTFTANTGLAGSFGNFTPTDIMTVYGTNTNVGIGTTTPVTTALLEMSSTTKGFLPPRMTQTQRNNIVTPATGLTIYCTDCTATDASTGVTQTYNGTTWKNFW